MHAASFPEPLRSAPTGDQLLVLRSPPSATAAEQAVREFLRAAVDEAQERLERLLTAQAFVNSAAGRQPARSFWQVRMAQLDYTELRGEMLYREADLVTVRAEDQLRLPTSRRVPLELARDEVAVRVPIRLSWAGRTRLFGDELLFRLQPVGAHFEIAEISEDFRLP